MGIAMRRSSKWWYAQFQVNGERRTFRMDVEVQGTRPPTLRVRGDADFEASREKAVAAAERMQRDAQASGADLQYHRRMAGLLGERAQTKAKAKPIPACDLFAAWKKASAHSGSPGYEERVRSVCAEFGRFAEGQGLRRVRSIQPEHARKFIEGVRSKATAGTVNSKLVTLRSVFRRIAQAAGLETNPFDGIPTLPDSPIHRRPLTDKEIDTLLQNCDPIIRGPVITGIDTALRRADACCLKWESIDLKAGFVRVRTQKTGEWAEIPLFPRLKAELKSIPGSRKPDSYVWPDAARMYLGNPSGISYRVRKAMTLSKIDRSKKRDRGINLNASIADFHALRTTWITKALTRGVPIELVRRVTGHTTVDIVLNHYFQPGRKEFKAALAPMMRKPRVRTKKPDSKK